LSKFKITVVDWPVKYIDQNSTIVEATLSLNSSILVSTYFPKTKFVLKNAAHAVLSKNLVMVDTLELQIEFPNGESFIPGAYCLEV
jgi:hypothetical protein